jgi:carboxylate-amine ligase
MTLNGIAGYAPALPMEHNFTSSGYTIGIEEELMIVDGETYELANAIEQLLDDGDTDIKPELMESVCEIATSPCRNTAEAGR